MTIKEILDLDYTDVQRMTKRELAEVMKTSTRLANQRLQTLRTHSNYSREILKNFSSLRGVESFEYEGKTLNQMREIFAHERRFLAAKTSTIGGAKSFGAEAAANIGVTQRVFFSDEFDRSDFWKRYHEFMETYETTMYASRDVLRGIANAMRRGQQDDELLDPLSITDEVIVEETKQAEIKRLKKEARDAERALNKLTPSRRRKK